MAGKGEDTVDLLVDPSKLSRSTANVKYDIVCCQRCHQMLDVDANFHQLEETILSELSADTLRNQVPFSCKGNPVLEEPIGPSDIQNRIRVATLDTPDDENDSLPLGRRKIAFSYENDEDRSDKLRLMELLSSVSSIDHPICSSCTDSVMEEMEMEIQSVEKECATYEYFLKQFKKGMAEGSEEGGLDVEALEAQLKELQLEEMSLKEQMKSAEEEKKGLLSKVNDLKKERVKIRQAEDDYYREKVQFERELKELEEEQESVDNQMVVADLLLDKLKKTNVFNIAFHIWHQDQFGTINGFRLGRLPGSPVDWPEINAAWGQTVLLLYSLAKKMNFTFKKYRLVPFGSHSYVECLEDQNKKLPLYGDGGFKFFWDSKFDHAMAAFLECLEQFKVLVEGNDMDSKFCLPYEIDSLHARIRDKHSGASYCIRAQFNSVEQWTKALKWMLTNLKWAVAWVVAQSGDAAE